MQRPFRTLTKRQDRLQGANASVGSIAGIASPLFFGWVYAITIGTAPGVSFLIAAAILLASAAIGRYGAPKDGAICVTPMTIIVYVAAALAEIAGCFAFWAWLRLDKSPLWLVPGGASLALFAYLLTLVETGEAGRVYAAYGGIYIGCALLWLWAAEGVRPDRWDLAGVALCLLGASVILLAPHKA